MIGEKGGNPSRACSHNERLEGQKRHKLNQEPHNATVEEFIEGEPLGCKIGRGVFLTKCGDQPQGESCVGWSTTYRSLCSIALHLAKEHPKTITKREFSEHCAHNMQKRPI